MGALTITTAAAGHRAGRGGAFPVLNTPEDIPRSRPTRFPVAAVVDHPANPPLRLRFRSSTASGAPYRGLAGPARPQPFPGRRRALRPPSASPERWLGKAINHHGEKKGGPPSKSSGVDYVFSWLDTASNRLVNPRGLAGRRGPWALPSARASAGARPRAAPPPRPAHPAPGNDPGPDSSP